MGNLQKEIGRLKEAEASYTRAIILKPDYVEVYSNLGATKQELGKFKEAETSYIKANFLNGICNDNIISPCINKEDAIHLLGTMQGGYNVPILINQLKNDEYGHYAYISLLKTILLFDHYYDVEHLQLGH